MKNSQTVRAVRGIGGGKGAQANTDNHHGKRQQRAGKNNGSSHPANKNRAKTAGKNNGSSHPANKNRAKTAGKNNGRRSTAIVTSFIRDASSGRILIVRRSKKVRSMRGKWSGISGIIEGIKEKPLARAKIEISEEASINAHSLRLVSRAESLKITSSQYRNHEWMVHPFLFEADAAPKVRLNWENSEYRWVSMKDVARYDTVPDLCRVLLCLL